MTRRFLFAASVLVLGTLSASALEAQPFSCAVTGTGSAGACSLTHRLNGNVPTLVELEMNTDVTNFTAPTITNFGAGNEQLVTGPELSVRANRGWAVTIQAATANFSTAPSGVTKPAGDVGFGIVNAGAACSGATFAALSNGTASALFGGGAGNTARQLCFEILWNLGNDAPGNYELGMNLSLSAP